MISGTSKIWSKSGPVDLLTITKMLQRIQEKYGIILEQYYICQSGTKKSKSFEEMYVLGARVFVFPVFCGLLSTYSLNISCGDED